MTSRSNLGWHTTSAWSRAAAIGLASFFLAVAVVRGAQPAIPKAASVLSSAFGTVATTQESLWTKDTWRGFDKEGRCVYVSSPAVDRGWMYLPDGSVVTADSLGNVERRWPEDAGVIRAVQVPAQAPARTVWELTGAEGGPRGWMQVDNRDDIAKGLEVLGIDLDQVLSTSWNGVSRSCDGSSSDCLVEENSSFTVKRAFSARGDSGTINFKAPRASCDFLWSRVADGWHLTDSEGNECTVRYFRDGTLASVDDANGPVLRVIRGEKGIRWIDAGSVLRVQYEYQSGTWVRKTVTDMRTGEVMIQLRNPSISQSGLYTPGPDAVNIRRAGSWEIRSMVFGPVIGRDIDLGGVPFYMVSPSPFVTALVFPANQGILYDLEWEIAGGGDSVVFDGATIKLRLSSGLGQVVPVIAHRSGRGPSTKTAGVSIGFCDGQPECLCIGWYSGVEVRCPNLTDPRPVDPGPDPCEGDACGGGVGGGGGGAPGPTTRPRVSGAMNPIEMPEQNRLPSGLGSVRVPVLSFDGMGQTRCRLRTREDAPGFPGGGAH